MRAALPDINQEGRCEPCGGKRPPCQLHRHMKNTNFYQIKKNFNCNSKLVVHLIESRVCGEQYNRSTMTKLRARVNNYKSRHHSFRKEQKLSNQVRNKKRFHKHYLQSDHNEICDWEITIIDNAETEKSLR